MSQVKPAKLPSFARRGVLDATGFKMRRDTGSCWNTYKARSGKDFTGVENIVGIESALDPLHCGDRIVTQRQRQELGFHDADAMFAGYGTAHFDRQLKDATLDAFGGLALDFVGCVDHQIHVEVAIPDVTKTDNQQPRSALQTF